METMKVKPWSQDQGDHVLINKADFDPEIHESFDAKAGDAVTNAKAGDAPAMTAAEVLAMASGNFMSFKAAASKLLGDQTPSKKDEIVAALTALSQQ
jgi:hypothetical protein